jgi:glycosyltransferase involved in cell wall biosynthesis
MVKKIAAVTFWFPTKEKPLSFPFIVEHLKAISKTQHLAFVLYIRVEQSQKLYAQSISKYDYEGLKIVEIFVKSKLHKLLYQFPLLLWPSIKKRIKTENFDQIDVVHGMVVFPAGVLAYLIAKKINKPLVLTEHWSKTTKFLSSHLLSYLGRSAFNYATKVTFVSKWLQSEVCEVVPMLAEKSVIVPNVVDSHLFHYAEKIYKPGMPIRFITVASSWNADRDLYLIVNSLEQLVRQSGKSLELVIIGGGILYDEIKTLKWSYPIIFGGFQTRQEIASHLNHAHYFLFSSKFETFSVVTAEALVTGTPVLVSDVAALPELVKQGYGLTTPNTIEGWTAALEKLIGTHFETDKIAAESSEYFNADKIAAAFEKVYENIQVIR